MGKTTFGTCQGVPTPQWFPKGPLEGCNLVVSKVNKSINWLIVMEVLNLTKDGGSIGIHFL